MAWIDIIPLNEATGELKELIEKSRTWYPKEYETPVSALDERIVSSHTLIPQALYHAFSTFGVLMSPDLPLERRQHEMIATMVSVTNRCHY